MAALTWLLQANLRDRGFLAELMTSLDLLGEAWHAVTLVPFSPLLPEVPPDIEGGAIVCYGASFVPRVADRTSWKPGIFFDRDTFRWSTMCARWQELMFSSEGRSMTLDGAIEALDDGARSSFVRPDADDKLFDGGVYDAQTLRVVSKGAARESAVIVAEPRPIDAEWRCFVIDREVVDSSEYRRAGQPSLRRGAPPRVIELAEQAAARWVPAAVTCIDIASSGDRFGIVEANCFNASRFYAVDTRTVLERVAAHVRFPPSASVAARSRPIDV
ncbi:MAG: ATP-grasp domain-containing protein [Deltaproteobacteria bacterium]|nr:ATP-grasp domain-containing protein [Deltaproteobacteria bacterium]